MKQRAAGSRITPTVRPASAYSILARPHDRVAQLLVSIRRSQYTTPNSENIMKYREGAVMGALKRAKSFLADDGAVLAEEHAADFARAQRKVDEVLTRLMTYGVDQDGG